MNPDLMGPASLDYQPEVGTINEPLYNFVLRVGFTPPGIFHRHPDSIPIGSADRIGQPPEVKRGNTKDNSNVLLPNRTILELPGEFLMGSIIFGGYHHP